MITIVLIGTVTALAMFSILLKLFAGEPKSTEKLDKGDIIKQLLALSELENRSQKTKPAMPHAKPQPEVAARSAKSPEIKPAEKTSECLGC